MSQLLQTGDRVDKYRVESCLGVGGMGEVYLATHLYLNIQRALKILRLDLTEGDPTFRDRFVREARIAARFQHPNSIGVVDVESESDSGFLYLVMEYVEGQTLQEYLKDGVLDESQTLLVCRQIASALDAAWREMQLVHRDIKPGNIMITFDGTVKIADLGVAKLVNEDRNMTLTMDGAMIGTPDYASPEQLMDAGHVDTRTDIYSLGATMYEMLTGVRPFRGSNTIETVEKVLHETPPSVRRWNPDISPGMAALIERMMSKDPAVRPQTMGELIGIFDSMQPSPGVVYSELPQEMQEIVSKEVGYKAEQLAAEKVDTIRKKQFVTHVWYTLFAILIVGINLVLGYLYVLNEAAYRKAERKLEEAKDTELHETMKNRLFTGRKKTENRRYTSGVRYSSDGKTLLESAAVDSGQSYISVSRSAESFHPDAFRNVKSITRIKLPAKMLAPFAARIHEFPNLDTVIVEYHDMREIPDVSLPSHIRLSKMRIYRRRTYSPPAVVRTPRPKRVVKPVQEKKYAEVVLTIPKKEKPIPVPEKKKTEVKPEKQTDSLLTTLLVKTKELSDRQKKTAKTAKKDPAPAAAAPRPAVREKVRKPVDPNSAEYNEARKAGLVFSSDGRILQQARDRYIRECKVPEGVEIIRFQAFANCRDLEEVILPSSVNVIERFAFTRCHKLRTIKLSEGLKRIEYNAFYGCRELRELKLPESLEYFGYTSGRTKIKSLYIPRNVRHLSFYHFPEHLEIKIDPANPYLKMDPCGVVYGDSGKTLLFATKHKFPSGHYSVADGTEIISPFAFFRSRLTSITLPSSVKTIRISAFSHCTKLLRVNLSSGLQIIEPNAFYNCHNLDLVIPASVHTLGSSALAGVKSVALMPGNKNILRDRMGAIYEKRSRKLVYFPPTFFLEYYNVSKGTYVIGRNAFLNCIRLREVTLPLSLKQIESRAFYNCSHLRQVNIPSNVKRVESFAFGRCTRLKKVTISKKTGWARNAFEPYVEIRHDP